MNGRTAVVLALACTAAVAVPSGAAMARDDDRRESKVSGTCSRGAEWELKAKLRDSGLEIEFEVDSGRGGRRWAYTVSHNGTVVASGTRRTKGRSGSFTVEHRNSSTDGVQTVTARAQNPRTGEVCLGVVQV